MGGHLDALYECIEFYEKENLSVGVTTGSVLVVASYLVERYPSENVVAIAPDGGESYSDLLKRPYREKRWSTPILCSTQNWKIALES